MGDKMSQKESFSTFKMEISDEKIQREAHSIMGLEGME
jgi:hypothetical protein